MIFFEVVLEIAHQQHGVSWVGCRGPTHYVVTPTQVELS
jgi:hypothetical protein